MNKTLNLLLLLIGYVIGAILFTDIIHNPQSIHWYIGGLFVILTAICAAIEYVNKINKI